MSITISTPTTDAVHELLEMLLVNRKPSVRTAAVHLPESTDLVGEYRRADGTVGAIWLVDRVTAIYLAAALVALPRTQTAEAVAEHRLDGILDENFREIANVLGSLVNGPESDHLTFTGYQPVSAMSTQARDVYERARDTLRAVGYAVSIGDAHEGNMSIFLDT